MRHFRLLLVFLSLVFTSESIAQVFDIRAADAKKVKGRKLIVVMEDTSSVWSKRNNDLLKELVPLYWDSVAIEFLTIPQVKELANSGGRDYFTLEFSSLRKKKNPLLEKINPEVDPRATLWNAREHGYFELSFLENFGRPFFTFRTPVSAPIEGDFRMALQQIAKYIAFKKEDPALSEMGYLRIIADKAYLLKNKTLLIDTLQLKRVNRSFKYVSEEYTENYRLTDFVEVTSVIKGNDSVTAYTAVVPYVDAIGRGKSFEGTAGGGIENYEGNIYYFHIVINAQNGEIISFAKDENANIERKSLRQFVRYYE